MHGPPILQVSVSSSSVYVKIQIFLTPFLISILIHVSLHRYCHWVYACVSGSQLHVGLLSPSHTSGAGSGTEHPEGLKFP